MDRVVKPLSKFGAGFFARDQLLLMCVGTSNATGIEVDAKSGVRSGQVSCFDCRVECL